MDQEHAFAKPLWLSTTLHCALNQDSLQPRCQPNQYQVVPNPFLLHPEGYLRVVPLGCEEP